MENDYDATAGIGVRRWSVGPVRRDRLVLHSRFADRNRSMYLWHYLDVSSVRQAHWRALLQLVAVRLVCLW